jgi:hypothetical protein
MNLSNSNDDHPDLANLLSEIRLCARHNHEVVATLRAALAPLRNSLNRATLTAAAADADSALLAKLTPERRAILRLFAGNDIHAQAQRARGVAPT